ncbi:hypothetical protein HY418_03420 [Candidatus Kaiserbacteria bacterium]|nr:hypothetical protein [Candidatus Kaiserbacteria bacterium]
MRMLIAITFLVSTLLVGTSYAAAQIMPGCHSPSAAEIEAGALPGTQVCPADVKAGITNDAGQAKQYLLSIARNLRYSQAPPDKTHIDALNNSFAICAANFLKAYAQHYGPVYVVSAFRCGPRSPANINCDRSENGRAGGATNSNHQIGVAMDINLAGGNSSYDTLRSFAQQNPGYGVNFPWPFYNGSIDKPHMQATNKSSPSCSGVAGTPVTPSGSASQTPVTTAANLIRQALGLQQPPPQQQPAAYPQSQAQPQPANHPTANATPIGAPASDQSPTACTPSYFCSGNTYYYKTSSCSNLEIQTCTNGCDGDSCAISPVSSSINLTSGPTDSSSSGSGASASSGPSTIDLIQAYANPTTVDIAAADPVVLNQDLGNIASAVGNASASGDASQTQSGNTVALVPPGSQETFTSPDLAASPPTLSQKDTFTLNILESLKQSLLWALNYLRPFGNISSQTYAE